MFMHPALSRTHAALFFLLMTLSSCVTAAPPITVCFNPGGGCLNSVAAEIAKARTELRIQAYSLNAKNVADAVVEARKSGVNVGIILDKGSNAAESNATYFFTMNGIPTWLDSNHAVAHGNVIIIDKAIVIAGSFNFTKEAENRNAENVMIIRSSPRGRDVPRELGPASQPRRRVQAGCCAPASAEWEKRKETGKAEEKKVNEETNSGTS